MLPIEVIEFTYEHYFQRFGGRSNLIYVVVLVFLALAFAALFFIPASVVVKGTGRLTASGERCWIKAPVSGQVAALLVEGNRRVKKGDLLFTMESELLEEESLYLKKRKKELRRKISDLRLLTASCLERDTPVAPGTSLYRRQYELLKQRAAAATKRLQNALAVFRRNKYLFQSGVLAAAEFDEYRYSVEKARAALRLVYQEQGSRWQVELDRLKLDLSELSSREKKFKKEKELYTIRAPVDGSLQQVTGMQPGTFFSQGEKVAQLSPDSGMVARIWIAPADIGLVKEGMPVRLQVDAFNYLQWGMVTGTVTDISDDVLPAQEGAPVFEVKCRLDKAALTLDNGYRGELKKGMTLQARLLVTERTVFQLLCDNVDDWLDPYGRNKS